MSATTRAGVICAMESEARHLRALLTDACETPLSHWRRTRGRLGATQVDVVVSGIGLINAAAATATLCALDPPDALLNYGCAGAHRADLGPGDVILGARVVHASAQIVLPSGEREYKGFDYHARGARRQVDAIEADPRLLACAEEAAERLTLPPWPGRSEPPRIDSGAVASADIWHQHGETIRTLHGLHGSLCEDMEAAAVAQVAAIYGLPFLTVKDISNNELVAQTLGRGDGGWPSLRDAEDQLGLRAALVVAAVLGVPLSGPGRGGNERGS